VSVSTARHKKFELLHDVVVKNRLAAGELLRAELQDLAALLDARQALILRSDDAGSYVDALYERHEGAAWHEVRLKERFPQLPISPVKTRMVPDVREEPALANHPLIERLGTRSLLSRPLSSHGQLWHCIFGWRTPRPGLYSGEEMNLLDAFAAIAARLLELGEEQRAQAENAALDALTGLLSRTPALSRLHDAIAAASRNGTRVAFLYVDVDRFKWVNDTYGHGFGDAVLHEIGKRLRHVLRPYDVAGRIGGDEFAVIISDFSTDAELAEIGERLIATLSQPITIDGCVVTVSATVGVATYPADSSSAEELISRADTAMYAAKRERGAGMGKLAFYSPSAEERVNVRRVISRGLRADRIDREFVLCFQPIMDARDGRLARAEVLTRWLHPDMGLLAPSTYIDIARDGRLSSALDAWVIRKSMEAALELHRAGESIILQINVAEPVPAVLEHVTEFDGFESAARYIAIELNESLLTTAWEQCKTFMERARSLGIAVGIDHYGAVGIPLSRLSSLPVDFIKIDRGLTAEITLGQDSAAPVDISVQTARYFNWRVIVSGVQNDSQRRRLIEAGVDYLQGYFFGHPMTAIDFRAWRAAAASTSRKPRLAD
jgi:diguanylate cyclase (GGDEF)-like protein